MKKNYFKIGLLSIALASALLVNAETNITLPGSGTEDLPYLIGSYADLKLITNDLTAVYSLTADIDASASKTESTTGWTPIGTTAAGFSGKLLGHGHTISNLYINQTVGPVGLFGNIAGGTLDSIGILNANITSTAANTGALSGSVVSGTVTNSYSTGVVAGAGFVGGLIGFTNAATIDKSYSSATVSGATAVGGLIGSCNYSSTLSNSYSTGTVTVSVGIAGGLTGLMNGTLTNSYTRSNIVGGTQNIGGLVGYGMGVIISNSYSVGTISSTVATAKGSVGYYNTAAVMNFPASSATGLFWDTTVSGKTATGLGTGKTTTELKSLATFSTYDFSTPVWKISSAVNDGYPYLAWQKIPTTPTELNGANETNIKVSIASIKGGFVLTTSDLSTTGGLLDLYTSQGAKIKSLKIDSESTTVNLPQGQFIGRLLKKNGTTQTFKVIVL